MGERKSAPRARPRKPQQETPAPNLAHLTCRDRAEYIATLTAELSGFATEPQMNALRSILLLAKDEALRLTGDAKEADSAEK